MIEEIRYSDDGMLRRKVARIPGLKLILLDASDDELLLVELAERAHL